MRPTQLLDYIRNLALAFYNSILKLSINAHQLIAHWRSRINKKQVGRNSSSSAEATELQPPQGLIQSSNVTTLGGLEKTTSQQAGLSFKTPNSKKTKLYSILRRLSIRNFMEYCVIALNEASSSSCSNKFDLNACETLVWILGRQYDLPRDVHELVNDIKSKLWITYRRNFPPIDENARYTTDRGFGCMIRCGQMVLANALLYKNLGRDWRWIPNGLESNPIVYGKILRMFQDKENCSYSIHNIVKTGQQEGIVAGDWFGPNTIAQALKRISMAQTASNEPGNDEVLISIDAALDNVVVMDEIKARFKHKKMCNSINKDTTNDDALINKNDSISSVTNDTHYWVPGILFIQLRLGLTKINPLYFAALRKTFQFKNSLGIIGGRPNHALYLIGYTDNDIIYLDPHSTQQYIDFDVGLTDIQEQQTSEDQRSLPIDSTYHCACPERMPIDRLDPSLALCFYFHTEHDFDEWCSSSNDLLIKYEQAPMFEITKSRPYGSSSSPVKNQDLNSLKKSDDPEEVVLKSASDTNEEEFEMLG